MQTSAAATRIATASHRKQVQLVKSAARVLVDDTRLRGWQSTGSGSAWAAPTTPYTIASSATLGDKIVKGGSVDWDLLNQDLGVNTPVLLPDGVTTDTPYVSSIALNGTQDLVCFYANRFRNAIAVAGIYTIICTDDGVGHLYWSQPVTVCQHVATAAWNQESQMFVSFPRLQVINGEYWIVALECGREVNVITYHLVYFHSTDGTHWSRREVLAGVSGDVDESTVGVNKYNTATAFALADLIHGYLEISGTNCYLISKGGATNFVCPATSRVGVSNPAMQLDITPQTIGYSYSRPTSPGMLQTSFTVQNPAQMFDNSTILVPDARLIHQDGLVTTNGSEVLQLSESWIDQISGSKQMQKTSYADTLKIEAGDGLMHLRDLADDTVFEWDSPSQSAFDEFCDLTALSVVSGSFVVGWDNTGTALTAVVRDPNDSMNEDLGYIPQKMRTDGSIETKFRILGSIYSDVNANVGTDMAIAFQGKNERDFWAVFWFPAYNQFRFSRYLPTPDETKKIVNNWQWDTPHYDFTPTVDVWYWLKVAQYHNVVWAFISTDGITWTTMFNSIGFTNTSLPGWPVAVPNEDITAHASYTGFLARSVSTTAPVVGNIDATGGKSTMDAGGGAPLVVALQITTGAKAGTVTSLAGLFTQSGTPCSITIGITDDVGGSPGSLDNPLYSVLSEALNYSSSDAPNWRGVPIPAGLRLAAATSYWIFARFNGTLTGTEKWEYYTDTGGTGGTTKASSNLGGSWSTVSGKSMAACVSVDYDGGLIQYDNLYWTSGEQVQTIEELAHSIAAKAHVLNITAQSFLATADLSGGWQPAAKGVVGDLVLDCDVSGTPNAEVYLRATTRTNATTGYKIVIGSTMKIYYLNVKVCEIESLQHIPSSYHLRVVNQTQWFYVWINGALALTFHSATATTPGYVGVGVATFANLRIPDMREIKPYWMMQAGESPLQSLTNLVDKTRYKFWMRYDGSLAIGTFEGATAVDTYSDTVNQTDTVQTNRYAVSQIQPTGNYWALRWAAKVLDAVGFRRFKLYNYTDAFSNEDAYLAGKRQLQLTQQQGQAFTLNTPFPAFAAEPEDRITVTEPASADYYVNDISIEAELKSGKSTTKFGLRKVLP